MNKKPFPIGIHLGTVNSVVAVHKSHKTEIIPCQGEKITPSVVFYQQKGKEVTVGNVEELQYEEKDYDAIYESKRLIGRTINDTESKEYICTSNFSFYIKDKKNKEFKTLVNHNGKTVSKKPHEVKAEILKKLKQSAKDYLGYEVEEAVITVPAYFTCLQRHDTKLAADLAGLKVLMLMSEPIAAFLHYIKERGQENSLSLVFDLGGNTLDISIIETSESGVKVISSDTWLGGRNFDKAVLDDIIHKYKLSLNKQEERRLLTSVEKMKCSLSFNDETCEILENFNNKEKFKIELNRSDFETITSKLIKECINLIKKCLEKSGIEKTKIENIILVGGSTKIPKLKEEIKKFFNGKEVITDLDPDKAVACGAAIQASSMKQLINAEFKIVNVTPFSLGTRLIFDEMKTVIERNTPIPVEKSVTTVTAYNNQPEIIKKIYAGNRSRCSKNNFLGKVILQNIPQKPAGYVTINTTFAIDVSGLLKITSKETLTGVSTELEIDLELCYFKSTSDSSRNDADEDDKEFLKFVDKLEQLRNSCVKHTCNKKDETEDVEACKNFIKNLEELKFEERNELPKLVNDLKEKLQVGLLEEISSVKI